MKKFLCAALMAVICIGLVACVPMNLDRAKKKMKEEGYTVSSYTVDNVDGLEGGFVALKAGLIPDTIYALYFESIKEAKDYYEDLSDQSVAIQKGRWVYWGTEEAIDDFED